MVSRGLIYGSRRWDEMMLSRASQGLHWDILLHFVSRVFIVTRLSPRLWHGFQPLNGIYIWSSKQSELPALLCEPIRLSVVVCDSGTLHSRVTHHSITLMVAFFEPWEICLKQNRETHILNSVSYSIPGFKVLESWTFMAGYAFSDIVHLALT